MEIRFDLGVDVVAMLFDNKSLAMVNPEVTEQRDVASKSKI